MTTIPDTHDQPGDDTSDEHARQPDDDRREYVPRHAADDPEG